MTTGDTVELLSRVPVFEDLSREELERIAQVTVPRSLDPGGVLFREGDESNTCYVVRAGHARLLREHADHRTITLAHFGPGDFFGELAMFGDEHRSGTVDAIDELELIGILGNDMRRLIRERSDLALKLVVRLAGRLRDANDRLTRQSFQTVQSRVAGVLARLVDDARDEGAPDAEVIVNLTQADVAQLAGSSRESASRFLAVLERAGVIEQGRGRILVRRPEALEGYVF